MNLRHRQPNQILIPKRPRHYLMGYYYANKEKLEASCPENNSILTHAGEEFDKISHKEQTFYYQEAEKLKIKYKHDM